MRKVQFLYVEDELGSIIYPDDVILDDDDGLLKIVRSLDTQVFEADLVEAIKSQQQQIVYLCLRKTNMAIQY